MEAETFRASAPGRVNLIGDHTDYNGGFVLPLAIPQRAQASLRRRTDGVVRAFSANIGPRGDQREYRLGLEKPGQGWLDYVQGVTWVTAKAGYPCTGFDVSLQSTVPLGSGLSSSAALEVCLLRALRAAFDWSFDDVQLALLAQKVETEFVGAPVGVMDQMASSLADERAALFLDTRTLTYERVSLPADVELVVINSGITHSHAAGEYRVRRAECEKAAALLGVRQLRDLPPSELSRVDALPPPYNRRARHVVTENSRVLAFVEACRSSSIDDLGPLLIASHSSLRDDFQVSIPEIDLLVALACDETDIFGARLTGGGFGGSVVMLTRAGAGERLALRILARAAECSGMRASILVPISSKT